MLWDATPAGFTLNNPLRSAMLPPREKANSYQYHRDSELQADVKPGSNQFDFALHSL